MVFTAPGIPMLFQGQEFLEGNYFRDTVPVDWNQRDEFHGIVRLYRDLIRLRLNRDGFTVASAGSSPESITCMTTANFSPTTVGTKAARGTTS